MDTGNCDQFDCAVPVEFVKIRSGLEIIDRHTTFGHLDIGLHKVVEHENF